MIRQLLRLKAVALLEQLKIFQSIGRFQPPAEIPNIAIEHVARRVEPAGKVRANVAAQPRFLVFGIAPTLF